METTVGEKESLLNKKLIRGKFISATGILSMCVCAFVVAASSVCVQGLQRAVPDFELNAIRNGFAWILTALICLLTKTSPILPKKDFAKIGLYSGLLFFDTIGLYTSVTFIPLATQQAFYNTTTLVGGLVLLWTLMKLRPTVDKVVSILLCASGIVLVLQPDFIFETTGSNTSNSAQSDPVKEANMGPKVLNGSADSNQNLVLLGCGLSVGAGLSLAGLTVLFQFHSNFFSNKVNMLISFFWTYLFATSASVVVMFTMEQPTLPKTITEYLLVLGHTLCNVLIGPTSMWAICVIDGNTANILYSSSIIYMVVVQYTFFKNILPGNGNWIEIVGVCCIIIGSILSSVVQLLHPRKASTEKFVSTETEHEKLSHP